MKREQRDRKEGRRKGRKGRRAGKQGRRERRGVGGREEGERRRERF